MEASLLTWKARLDRNALWVSLGVIALAVAIVAVGVQVAPEKVYDHFVWEDIWGPLVADAHQCGKTTGCPGVTEPNGVPAKDGYTVTSELTYGAILAVMLYGIYVGLFRRFSIVADGHFVLALLPWILLGPLARTLEDANIFCQTGTDCTPGAFAYVFISPVIYIHIALYVIAFMLLGVFIQRRAQADPRHLTALVGSVLGVGVAAFALIQQEYAHGFHYLPPLWFVAASAILAGNFFYRRAKEGKATMNLTVFVLGVPFALACIYLIADWLAGNVWAPSVWNGEYHYAAGATIFAIASAVALLVRFTSRRLGGSNVESAWGRVTDKIPARADNAMLYAGLGGIFLAFLFAGAIPRLSAFVDGVGSREQLVPVMAIVGILALLIFAFLHVGREIKARPGVLLIFGVGLNVALVFAHMIDGVATWIALEDPFNLGVPNYNEKHPFSDFLLRFWDGFLFPTAKLVMVLVIVWLLDREFKENTADERNLVGLIKMAIFVLGFAPGLRDLLRVLMGV